jgi:arginase family enzyme
MKILKIAFNGGALTKRKGIEKAPESIEKGLKEFYLNENGISPGFSFENVNIDNYNNEESHNIIEKKASEESGKNKFVLALGGDHSITYSCFKGFAVGKENPGLIIFDAHPDCENNFFPPTHEDFVKVLVRKKIIKPENIILIGLRNWHSKEKEFLEKEKIKRFTMKQLFSDGLQESMDYIMELARQFSELYVSIDIDVIDPGFAPGTGYPEPGGLSVRELIYSIQRLKLLKNFKMADIVEFNPDKDNNEMTLKIAAKIIMELYNEND